MKLVQRSIIVKHTKVTVSLIGAQGNDVSTPNYFDDLRANSLWLVGHTLVVCNDHNRVFSITLTEQQETDIVDMDTGMARPAEIHVVGHVIDEYFPYLTQISVSYNNSTKAW